MEASSGERETAAELGAIGKIPPVLSTSTRVTLWPIPLSTRPSHHPTTRDFLVTVQMGPIALSPSLPVFLYNTSISPTTVDASIHGLLGTTLVISIVELTLSYTPSLA
ncbi:predicted protein [Histoplasma capsulatum var. duboisii H88]|uniref:Predicted protein n=1 Tax=Ajellomyces capsulatus (strain H88) TaxID=544711 RepID=F0UEU7_AJEC8|nr:predicted protein [Histoplasma capsulatum var. duboisii H88]